MNSDTSWLATLNEVTVHEYGACVRILCDMSPDPKRATNSQGRPRPWLFHRPHDSSDNFSIQLIPLCMVPSGAKFELNRLAVGQRYLLHDRDTKFRAGFRSVLRDGGVEPLRLPPSSPDLNAFAERWVRSAKQECLSKLILFGENSLRRALTEYVADYNRAESSGEGKRAALSRADCQWQHTPSCAMQASSGRVASVLCSRRTNNLTLRGQVFTFKRAASRTSNAGLKPETLPSSPRLQVDCWGLTSAIRSAVTGGAEN